MIFCIVSSDSDFTRLAIRFRESGKQVYGFGEQKTPESLRVAYNQFIYIEILSQNKLSEAVMTKEDIASVKIDKTKSTTDFKPNNVASNENSALSLVVKKTSQQLASDTKLVSLFRSTIDSLSDDDGYANTSEIKKHILKNYSAFDSRNYGYAKFSDLIIAISLFELDSKKQ